MHGDTLFEQTKEEHAPVCGLAAIEPEREFVQISLQVIFFERALMRTHQPALNERGNTVYARQDLVVWNRGIMRRERLLLARLAVRGTGGKVKGPAAAGRDLIGSVHLTE